MTPGIVSECHFYTACYVHEMEVSLVGSAAKRIRLGMPGKQLPFKASG